MSVRALVDERIDTRRAALVLCALQIASLNLRNVNFEPGPRKVVLEPPLELQFLGKPRSERRQSRRKAIRALSPRTGSDV